MGFIQVTFYRIFWRFYLWDSFGWGEKLLCLIHLGVLLVLLCVLCFLIRFQLGNYGILRPLHDPKPKKRKS